MNIISVVLHPLMMPLYMMLILAFAYPEFLSPLPSELRFQFLVVITICTFVIPAISMVVFKSSGWISSYSIEKREERIVPFLFVVFVYGFTTYTMMTKLEMNSLVNTILASTTGLLLILTVITGFYKISIHNAAAWGTAGFLYGIFYKSALDPVLFYLALVFILLSGLVGTARLFLGAHTPRQVLHGSLLGFFLCLIAVMVYG